MEQTSDPPDKVLDQAAMQILRGSTNPASIMGAHSLLEDMYGGDTDRGTVTIVNNNVCSGQLIEFTVRSLVPVVYRIGCVISLYDKDAGVWRSSRIVGTNPSSGNPLMLAFDAPLTAASYDACINGLPFSGGGFGFYYDTAAKQWKSKKDSDGHDLALLPNAPQNRSPSGYGALVNSDYTAADFQHMLLAAQVPEPRGTEWVMRTLPTLYRPALVRYWVKSTYPAADFSNKTKANFDDLFSRLPPDLACAILMRPSTIDHPNFTGSNPRFSALWDGSYIPDPSDPNYPDPTQTRCLFSWDVDNDGDGVPDSVWVDLGMPVRAAADGRLYKPLFAILCTDLDGRLNLNTDGCLAQTDTTNYDIPSSQIGGQFAGGISPTVRGEGFGPAEINPAPRRALGRRRR